MHTRVDELCVKVHVCAGVYGALIFTAFPIGSLSQGLSVNPRVLWCSLRSPSSPLPKPESQASCRTHLAFSVGSNTALLACVANTLTTQPSPEPLLNFFFYFCWFCFLICSLCYFLYELPFMAAAIFLWGYCVYIHLWNIENINLLCMLYAEV